MKKVISKFFYDMTLSELQRMKKSALFGRLSYNSLLYLDLIDMTPHCTVSRLAALLQVTKSAVTIKVGEMQKLGLVDKIRSQDDKRVFYLRIKPEIEAEYRTYNRALMRGVKAVEKKYAKKDIDLFCAIFSDFSKAYTEKQP